MLERGIYPGRSLYAGLYIGSVYDREPMASKFCSRRTLRHNHIAGMYNGRVSDNCSAHEKKEPIPEMKWSIRAKLLF